MDEGRSEEEALIPAQPIAPATPLDSERRAVLQPPSTEAAKKEELKEGEKEVSAIREWFELIGRAAFWALILYLFFFQVSVVEGPSMEPSFHTNDRLVIDKITYRFSKVHRFDVIVFQALDSDRSTENKDYIKRVIGLPGEKVEL